MLGSTFKKALCSSAAIALIAAAGMTASKDAEAAASAYSALEVSAMGIFFSSGVLADIGVVDGSGAAGGGFTSFSFTSQGGSVQLGGLSDSQGLQTTALVTTSGSTLNQDQLCLADCTGFTPDSYVLDSGGGVAVADAPSNKHAVSDSNMLNTVLNGLSSANFGTQAGAKSAGGAQLAAGTIGAGSTMNWNFTTDDDDAGKTLSLSWIESRLTEIIAENAGDIVQAGLNFTITLSNGGSTQALFNLDDASGDTADLFSPFGTTNEQGVNDIGTSFSTTADGIDGVLTANTSYELVFQFDSFAQATSTALPEPGALGLMGVGLIGLGALGARRRRQRKTA